MNQKDQRIKKLLDRGVTNKAEIARKIGYGGNLAGGIERVEEGIKRLGFVSPSNKMMGESPERKTV